MLPIIAVFRVADNGFVYYDLTKSQFSDMFSVGEMDGYRQKTYSQIIFSEYDEENQSSRDLISVTVTDTEDGKDLVLKDLSPERLVAMIRHVFTDLNLDKVSEGQVSILKH